MSYMKIRKAEISDLMEISCIYAYAREQMKKNGNPDQWGDDKPSLKTIRQDIESRNSYILESGGKICGVFVLVSGDEPTYQTIDGKWLNDKPYGTIHRVAGNGTEKGILKHCLEFCERRIGNIRIDTHKDNVIMQHLLVKCGYNRCGIIYVEDGTPRIAYQKYILLSDQQGSSLSPHLNILIE